MQLTKIFVVFVVLIGRICLSKLIIDTKNRDEFAELETAAGVVGDFPVTFIQKLSVHKKFDIVVLDPRRRVTDFNFERLQKTPKPRHEVHIFVTIAADIHRFVPSIQTYMDCRYYATMPYVLILGWSPKGKTAICDGTFRTVEILYTANKNRLLHANLICRHHTRGILIYGFNAFTNYPPKPWQFAMAGSRSKGEKVFTIFVRKYRDDDGMCENIFFDKTHNLHGWPVEFILECTTPSCAGKLEKRISPDKRVHIETGKRLAYIRDFITYVNITQVPVWIYAKEGTDHNADIDCFHVSPFIMRGVRWTDSYTHPFDVECKYLITQFRGNKSQMRKIFDIIDSYSWVDMLIVFFITLIFFKFFLHQTLIEGLLNICRLTCNVGLTTSPRNLASRIYFGCLLFFMVTILGIFTGNLASLLTHDTPVRQVETIRDLADLHYTVRAYHTDVKLIEDSGFKGRIIKRLIFENCVRHVKRNPLVACVSWGSGERKHAEDANLHISSGCIATEYVVHILPVTWPLHEQINTFLLIKIGGGILADFDAIVLEKRVLEADSQEKVLDPVIMTLVDLRFAFIIFGIGFGCAFISFIVEIMIYRFQRRVTTTRVIVLN